MKLLLNILLNYGVLNIQKKHLTQKFIDNNIIKKSKQTIKSNIIESQVRNNFPEIKINRFLSWYSIY